MKPWKIDWKNRIIFLSHILTNIELIQLFTEISITHQEQMTIDGPNKTWKIIIVSESN